MRFGYLVLAWFFVTSFLLLIPDLGPQTEEWFAHQDKAVHVILFSIGTFLILMHLIHERSLSGPGAYFGSVFVMIFYGATTELLQGFISGRSRDWEDFIANTAGILLTTLLYFIYQKRKQ